MVSEEEIKKIVIARLESLPSSRKISIGSSGEFDKDELIQRIKTDDPIGRKMVQIELEFLRSLKKGISIYTLYTIKDALPYLAALHTQP